MAINSNEKCCEPVSWTQDILSPRLLNTFWMCVWSSVWSPAALKPMSPDSVNATHWSFVIVQEHASFKIYSLNPQRSHDAWINVVIDVFSESGCLWLPTAGRQTVMRGDYCFHPADGVFSWEHLDGHCVALRCETRWILSLIQLSCSYKWTDGSGESLSLASQTTWLGSELSIEVWW